jgi:hypothetical protein
MEDLISKCTGTIAKNLIELHFRQPRPDNNNDHSGIHGGDFPFDQFVSLSIEELGEAQRTPKS